MYQDDVRFLESPKHGDFIRVGLGNIDKVTVIDDGDIKQYPVQAYFSSGQECERVVRTRDGWLIKSVIKRAPKRCTDAACASTIKEGESVAWQTLEFESHFNYVSNENGIWLSKIEHRQVQKKGDAPDFDFMEASFESDALEQFYGLGLQYTESNFKGKEVHMISSEGGVGRGLQPLTDMLNAQNEARQGGSTVTTYAPAYTFTTSRRRGFTLGNHTEIGKVDFRDAHSFGISLWKTSSMSINVVHAPTLKKVVTGLTSIVGRMRALPQWTQEGAIVGLQGGQDKVERDYAFLKSQGVPIKAVWMQDWVGTNAFPEGVRLLWNWQLNRKHYYDWEGMTSKWAKDGVRPMVYMNPYFANLADIELRKHLFQEADSQGLFVKDDKNASLLIKSISIEFGMVDFTNPAGKRWARDLIINNMIKEAGAIGWMADFAEYTPLTGHFQKAVKGSVTEHNKYPYDWAKTNWEALKETGKDDEIVYFMRAGSTMSPGVTSLYWMGDQLPTFDRYDGMHSALIGLLNGGMSGFTIGHSDIGGYTSLNDTLNLQRYRRDEQLLIRWMEMSAFSDAVFRTHPSNKPDFNAQIWDNAKIAGYFKKFAEVHINLGSYRMKLMKEMELTGLPIVRSLALEFDQPLLSHIDDQFMLGEEILVAPVFTRDADKRRVYFPYIGDKFEWQHYFTGKKVQVHERRGLVRIVDAPLGHPAAYKKVARRSDENSQDFVL